MSFIRRPGALAGALALLALRCASAPANLTAGIRVKYVPTRRSPDLGFRCARDP